MGSLFQDEVLSGLTSGKSCTLRLKPLFPGADEGEVAVPNAKQDLLTLEALGSAFKPFQLRENLLYNPKSKNFPAVDFFFLVHQGDTSVLWLLQTTKQSKHGCKIDWLQTVFRKYFTKDGIDKISAIKWVLLMPSGIDKMITQPQAVAGQWQKNKDRIQVEQYVSKWEKTQ